MLCDEHHPHPPHHIQAELDFLYILALGSAQALMEGLCPWKLPDGLLCVLLWRVSAGRLGLRIPALRGARGNEALGGACGIGGCALLPCARGL